MKKKLPKQTSTLETSKKKLYKSVMECVHRGGLLFSNNGKGIITPVIINATIQQIVVAILAFIFSRAKTATETTELYDYVISTADRLCKLRLNDVPAPDTSSEGKK